MKVPQILLDIEEVKSEIHDLESVKFAIWYHDIIYKSTKKDNEEKSADLMEAAEEKSDELKAAGEDKLKEACIEMKKKTGGDESEC